MQSDLRNPELLRDMRVQKIKSLQKIFVYMGVLIQQVIACLQQYNADMSTIGVSNLQAVIGLSLTLLSPQIADDIQMF